MHMLEDHVVDFISRWKCGFGFYGEQGGESIHNEMNQIKSRFCTIKNPIERLTFSLKQHYLRNAVQAQKARPAIKRRRLTKHSE